LQIIRDVMVLCSWERSALCVQFEECVYAFSECTERAIALFLSDGWEVSDAIRKFWVLFYCRTFSYDVWNSDRQTGPSVTAVALAVFYCRSCYMFRLE